MDDDFDLLALHEFESKDPQGNTRKGYQAFTSTAPRNHFDKVLDGVNRAALSIQIQLPEKASEKARRAASKGELYLFGALDAIDRTQTRRGEPPLREALGHYICNRGWFGMRALVYLPKGETETVFDVQPWDPINMTWEYGPRGLLWAGYKRLITKAAAFGEYGVEIQGQTAVVLDFWDTERNSAIIANAFVKEPEEHRIGRVPVLIGAVGSMPTIHGRAQVGGAYSGTTADQMLALRGDSVWAASRGLYEPRNKYISWLMDTAARSVSGSLVHTTKPGSNRINEDPHKTFQIIRLEEEGETLKGLELPQMGPEAAAVLGIMNDDLQQSALPYPLAYGGPQAPEAGIALSIRLDQTRSVYNPRTEAGARAYTWLCEELLAQFATKGTKTSEVQGYQADGSYFRVKVKPVDIDIDWRVSVKVEPRLPRDEVAEIQMALAATQRRGPDDIPLVSKHTARESYLKLRDPDAEEDKSLIEMAKGMPPIIAAQTAAALQRAGEDELAEQVAALLQAGPAAPPRGGGPGVPPTGPPTGPPPAGPAGQQPGQPPVPPEVQVLQAVTQVLRQAGADDLAQALVQALQGGPAQPGLIEAVLEVLTQAGQGELAQAFLAVLQAGPPQGPPPQGPTGPPQGPPGPLAGPQ